jgi:hypothetical protein
VTGEIDGIVAMHFPGTAVGAGQQVFVRTIALAEASSDASDVALGFSVGILR